MKKPVYLRNNLLKFRYFHPEVSIERLAEIAGCSRGTIQRGLDGFAIELNTVAGLLEYIKKNTPYEFHNFPEDIQALFMEHTDNELRPKEEFLPFLNNRLHLIIQLPALKKEDINAISYHWLLSWIYQDLAKNKINPNENLVKASAELDKIIEKLKLPHNSRYKTLQHKANLAKWVISYTMKLEGTRHNDPENIKYINDNKLLETAHECVKEEPYGWSVIRNALIIASILNSIQNCRVFYNSLIKAEPDFKNLDYKPPRILNVKSLRENPDLEFFVKHHDEIIKDMKEFTPKKPNKLNQKSNQNSSLTETEELTHE